MPGYSGINCTWLCPYPQYGVKCQRTCNCSENLCNVSTGCIGSTTGKHIEKYLQSKAVVNENVIVPICNSMYIIWYFYYIFFYNCLASLLQINEIIV